MKHATTLRDAARSLPNTFLALAHNGARQAGPTEWLSELAVELTRRRIVSPSNREWLAYEGKWEMLSRIVGLNEYEVRRLRAAGH